MSALSETQKARQYFSEALLLAMKIEVVPLVLEILVGIAKLISNDALAKQQAVELFSFVQHHPSSDKSTHDQAKAGLQVLAAELEPDVLAEARTRGASAELGDMLTRLKDFFSLSTIT